MLFSLFLSCQIVIQIRRLSLLFHICANSDTRNYQEPTISRDSHISRLETFSGRIVETDILPQEADLNLQSTDATRRGRKKVGFIFAHERPHQMPHVAPIINEICQTDESVDVHAFVLGKTNVDVLKSLLTPDARKKITITLLKAPLWARLVERMIGGAGPLERLYSLRAHANDFAEMTVLAAPDLTSLTLRKNEDMAGTILVYTSHGAGDRAVGFNPKIGKFDHVFVPGDKIRTRMLEQGVISEGQYSVVGYPKFDGVACGIDEKPSFFDNDKPVVLYNPHFDPTLSSWFEEGEAVLDYFVRQDRYNLIFAPHVMLFTRKLHVTSDLKIFKLRKRLSKLYARAKNIHVDVGSTASIDMSYTQAADIYLGDASSQVYEFLTHPRPSLFIDVNETDWRSDPNFAHWHLGDVISSAAELGDALASIEAAPEKYAQRQEEAFLKTFGANTAGSAKRAAKVLLKLAQGSPD